MKTSAFFRLLAFAVLGMVAGEAAAQYPAPAPFQGPPGVAPAGMMPPAGYVAPAGYFAGGDEGGAPGNCDCGTCEDCCCPSGGFDHRWYFYGDSLYLRPRDAEVAWAAPIDGPIVGPPANNPIQIRPLGVVDLDYQPGWRGGFQYNSSECSGIGAQFTMWEGSTNDFVNVAAPDVIRSLVSHPGTQTAAQDFLSGEAHYNINFKQIDLELRRLISWDVDYQLGYSAGATFVQMEQTLDTQFRGAGFEQVLTDIDFYGAGARFGLFGEYQFNSRWRVYGKGIGNLVAGEFKADYDQRQSFDPVVVDTAWHGGRIVGIWDLEVGTKWVSRCGNYSANIGYMFSAWTNTLQTDEWIRGVRSNSFIGMDSTMTFDGLVARFEARY